eukprot:12636751-Alexandrium_andersonii.AAC.1
MDSERDLHEVSSRDGSPGGAASWRAGPAASAAGPQAEPPAGACPSDIHRTGHAAASPGSPVEPAPALPAGTVPVPDVGHGHTTVAALKARGLAARQPQDPANM